MRDTKNNKTSDSYYEKIYDPYTGEKCNVPCTAVSYNQAQDSFQDHIPCIEQRPTISPSLIVLIYPFDSILQPFYEH